MTQLYYFGRKLNELLPELSLGAAVLLITILTAFLIRKFIVKQVKIKTNNPLLVSFIGKMVALTINLIGIVAFLGIIGLGDVSSKLLAGAGIITFVVGFAFKDIGENFLSGILLAFKSPFGIDDLIETDNIVGYVTEVSLRETIIKTLDGKDVFVPNSQIIKNPLTNYTVDGFLRSEFTIGVDYECDIKNAISIIEQSLASINEVLKEKAPLVAIDELLASSINIRVNYWIDTFSSKSKSYHTKIRSNVIQCVMLNLVQNGIYLPADIVEVKNYSKSILKINN